MNTKFLMVASAFAMGVAGLLLTFLPHELLNYLNATPVEPLALVVQLLGALYLSMAMLNWMAKANLIGGIYSRPVAIGNFLHFFMGAILFLKAVLNHTATAPVWVACVIYSSFALLFGALLFRHPLKQIRAVSIQKPA